LTAERERPRKSGVPPLLAKEVQSTRRGVVAEGVGCRWVVAVALGCVERRGDRGTKKVVTSSRVPVAQDVPAGYHVGTRDTPVLASATACSGASTMGRCGSDRLDALTPRDVAATSERGRRPVLHWFARHYLIHAHDRLAWTNSGFSLEALPLVARRVRATVQEAASALTRTATVSTGR